MRSLISVLFITAVLFALSCTKIDSTVLGGDLIPPVDNVITFDTVMNVETINMLQSDDTTVLSYTDLLAVGAINDPLFGQSVATLSFEMKPTGFSASAISLNLKDSLIGYDSTVLCLRYSGGFGDTTADITFNVYMLTDKFKDTASYNIKEPPPAAGVQSVGSKTVSLRSLLKDSINIYRSTTFNYKTINELRIRLDPSKFDWLNTILKDSSKLASDSGFRTVFKGFAVKATVTGTPGSMAYFNISDTASKLEFFYRRKNNGADTTRTAFYFNPNNSGFADNIIWTRNGAAEINQHLSPVQPDSLVYIKTTPGTAARIRIPGLQNLSNRIIHRAELKMYQVPVADSRDGFLVVPPLLYLERFEPGNIAYNKYQSIPVDLSPNSAYGDCFPVSTGIDYASFGGFPKDETVNSMTTKAYSFNISRYVQQIITKKLTNTDLRLSSNLYSQYDGCGVGTAPFRVTTNPIGYGRVRLGGGNTTGSNLPYKMRLRIIYSKL